MRNPEMLRLDAYSVRLFVAAAREGSIARAAQSENIAASALSRRIADLEHALGAPLIVRSARGIALTGAGMCVFERGKKIEADLRALANEVASMNDEVAGTVQLAANPSSIVGFLPERLQAFKQEYPGVAVALQESRSWEVIRACLDDRADVGIGVTMDVPKGIDSWHFADDPLIVLLPLSHKLAEAANLSFKQAVEAGLVGIQEGGALDQILRQEAEKARYTLEPTVMVNSFDAACRMVEAGFGLAILPTSAAAAYAGTNRFARCTLSEPWAQRKLSIYAARKSPRPKACSALIAKLKG